MKMYLTVETTIQDVFIDFIEVRLNTGEVVSLNWDESEIAREETKFLGTYKGVCFGEEYANGRINELKDMVVVHVEVYTESKNPEDVKIVRMEFNDGEDYLDFEPPTFELGEQ